MTLEELERKIAEMMPTASVDTDNHGQLIIYTGLQMKDPNDYRSEVVEFKRPSEED